MRIIVAIDNGVTGSISFIFEDGTGAEMYPTPTVKVKNFQKPKRVQGKDKYTYIRRVDVSKLTDIFESWVPCGDVEVFMERPYYNPRGLKATESALRCLEATLIVLDQYGLTPTFVDSRLWQKAMLPPGCSGGELKSASVDIGVRVFPKLAKIIRKQNDADSLLMAEWARERLSQEFSE